MNKRIPKMARRFLVLLLCLAVVLPMLPKPAPVTAAASAAVQEVIDETRSLYSGGTKSNALELDCGNGLTGGGEKTYMTIVTGTTATHFSNYQTKLKNAGYQVKGEWTIKSNSSKPNSFGSYLSPDGNCKVYTYFLPDYSETRIIVDTQEDTVEGYKYESQTGKTVEPKLVLWGLSMSESGYSTGDTVDPNKRNQRNCGAMVVIRMPDNSLFIHDGGDVEQWNDQSCDDFVAFCRELTGTPEGQKMVINTWFLSHAHKDHYRGFYRLLNKKYGEFDLKNVMYTIDKERSGDNFDITGLLGLIRKVYPGVRYYKPHTGEKIDIAGVTLDVIYTLEDRFIPNSSNKLIIDTDNKDGTYRDGLYKDSSTKTYDFNDTSTVIRITFENGVNSILYADATRAKTIYKTIYPTSFLKTDIMMVPHHGHNEHTDLVSYADSKVYLYTQHKGAAYGPDNDVSTLDMYNTYHEIVKSRFIAMFPGMNVPAGTEKVDYDVFWGGSETVTIDINTLGKVIKGTSTAKYYTSQPAPNYGYTGWGVTDLISGVQDCGSMLVGVDNWATLAEQATTNHTNRYNPVATGELTDNKRYLIQHKNTQFIMAYEAVANVAGSPNGATSLRPVTQAELDTPATDVYYQNDKGVYIEHSNRDRGLWIMSQEGNSSTALKKSSWKSGLYGGTAYGEVWLNKGTKDELKSDGTFTSHNGKYWYSVYGQDGNSKATQYRYLDQRYVDDQWVKTSEPTGTDSTDPKRRYIIEDLGNGDFLIYWRSESGATVSFLTCDAYGNWGVKSYTDSTSDEYPSVPSKGSAELESLKLKLYVYTVFSKDTDIKTIAFSGYQTFNVKRGTTLDQALYLVQQNVALKDTTRWSMHVPCSGTTPKVGYYYMTIDKKFDSSENGEETYTVTLKYYNDDHTDTQIATVTINVVDQDVSFTGAEFYEYTYGVTLTEIYKDITQNIKVTTLLSNAQGVLNNAEVAYSATPEAGKYWLNAKASTDGDAAYFVDVNYRNTDGSDVLLKTLTVYETGKLFTLAGANTVLGGVLDMNFFITPSDLNGTDYYAEIILYSDDGISASTIPYADWDNRTNYMVVTQKGLAARQMADVIQVVIYNGDGTQASEVWTDSIRDYAMRILEKEDAKTKTMLVDMLNYGAAAQTFFNYNLNDLANSQLTNTQKAYGSKSVSCTDKRVQGENYFGSSLVLKDRIQLTMYFRNVSRDMYAIVRFTDHKGNAHETRIEGSAFAEYNSTTYGVTVEDLVVADGDQLVTVTVYDAAGRAVASASDSVNSYAARQQGKDALYEMVAKFTASAYTYLHS